MKRKLFSPRLFRSRDTASNPSGLNDDGMYIPFTFPLLSSSMCSGATEKDVPVTEIRTRSG